MSKAWNKGDLFRWSFKKTPEHMPYHCCSQIAEFNGQRLRDTFWYGSDGGRTWTQDEAESRLDLRYLGNRDDLDKQDASAYFYYRREDIVDLRHSNNMDSRDVWVRKGAQRDPAVMREHIRYVMKRAESEIEMATRRIEQCQEQLEQVESGNLNIYLIRA